MAKKATPAVSRCGVILAVNISERKGQKKHDVGRCRLLRDFGIDGDAHAGTPTRQVSLLSQASVDKMTALGLKVGYGDFAENFTIARLIVHELPVGTLLKIGATAVLRITRIGKECHARCEIYRLVGDCIMPREGVFADVLTEGEVRVGDEVTVVDAASDTERA